MTERPTRSSTVIPLRILSGGPYKPVVLDMAPSLERAIARPIHVENDTAGAMLRRLRDGEEWDLVIAPPATLELLVDEGRIAGASIKPLARVGIGVAVSRGSPKPDISTVERFRQTVLDARHPAFIDPKAGGSSGIYLAGLFERLGIADAIRSKAVLVPGGLVAERLVSGEADLAIHQISEILPVEGAELVGALPNDIQNYTTYAAAVTRSSLLAAEAERVIDGLRSDEASPWTIRRGLEPVR